MKFALPLLLACTALTNLASAVVVNIDFNSASNTMGNLGAAPDAVGNTHWNALSVTNPGAGTGSITSLNLRDSSNTVTTTIDLTMTGLDSAIGAAAGQQEHTGAHLNLMRDYLRIDSGSTSTVRTETGKFSGLTVGANYEIYFYGQGEHFTTGSSSGQKGQNTMFTIGSESKKTGWDTVAGGDGFLVENIEYVKFEVAADANGEIIFSWSNIITGINGPDPDGITPGSRYAALNGIQLKSVPEPSAVLLGGLGVVGLMVRRRR